MLEERCPNDLTYLEANGGFMTLNDKSSPEEIRQLLGFQRSVQKALGGLMKVKKSNEDQFGTKLI